jgi:hypothetical protein
MHLLSLDTAERAKAVGRIRPVPPIQKPTGADTAYGLQHGGSLDVNSKPWRTAVQCTASFEMYAPITVRGRLLT